MNRKSVSAMHIGVVALLGLAGVFYYLFRHQPFLKAKDSSVIEKTFAIIKPDAVAAKNSGKIIDIIEQNGFTIVGMRKLHMSKATAELFYAVHKDRPFFKDLVEFMISGPVIVMALEKDNAIKAWRDLMGATDPVKAEEGTLRKLFGTNMGNNATHGSDAPETARTELTIFFPELN